MVKNKKSDLKASNDNDTSVIDHNTATGFHERTPKSDDDKLIQEKLDATSKRFPGLASSAAAMIGVRRFFSSIFSSALLTMKDWSYHVNHILEENIKLGVRHIRSGALYDANLRFYIASKLFLKSKLNADVPYWEAWSFMLRGMYDKATQSADIARTKAKEIIVRHAIDNTQHTDNSKENDTLHISNSVLLETCEEFYDYLLNMHTAKNIKRQICNSYYDLTSAYYIEQHFYNQGNSIVSNCLPQIAHVISNEASLFDIQSHSPYRVLELGASTNLTYHIKSILPKYVNTTGIESYVSRFQKMYILNGQYRTFDDIVLDENVFDKALNLGMQYDFIISADSFSTSGVLKDSFQKVKNLLSSTGIFVVILPSLAENETNSEVNYRLSAKDNWFVYKKNYVKEQLLLADFKIRNIIEIEFNGQSYFMVIAL